MWVVTEGNKHLLAWIGIQTLQNAHNTNIILNSQAAQIRHVFKAIWARVF